MSFEVQHNFELCLDWISKLLLMSAINYCIWRWYHASVKYFFVLTPSVVGKNSPNICVPQDLHTFNLLKKDARVNENLIFNCIYYLAAGHKFLEQCFE